MFHTQWSQSVDHGVDDRGAGRDRPRLADAFDAEGIDGRWGLSAVQLEVHQIIGLGHCIIHQRTADELSILVIDRLFIKRLGDALGQPTVDLPVDQEGIDHPATARRFRDRPPPPRHGCQTAR